MFAIYHRHGTAFSVYQGGTDYFEYALMACRELRNRGLISGFTIIRAADGVALAQSKGI